VVSTKEFLMTRLLNLRVADEAFAQAFAWVAACLLLNACTALALLALPTLDDARAAVVLAGVAVGWIVMGAITYRGLRQVTAARR
jgi:hypothetical protein